MPTRNVGAGRRGGRLRQAERGAALILTLTIVAIVSIIAAGIGSLVVSHYSRATNERDAARALDAAEAAVNFQVQRIYANLSLGNSQVLYNGSNVDTATYALLANPLPVTSKLYNGATSLNGFLGLTTTGTNPDYCKCWIQYPASSTQTLDLNSSADVYIYGQAQVNGVVRTVRAKAGATDIFKKWAIFSYSSTSIGGSFSVIPLSGSPLGVVGSDGTIDIAKDTAAVGAQIVYGTGTADTTFPATYGGRKVELTPINDLATAAYNNGSYTTPNTNTGIAKFSQYNDNLAYGLATKGKNTVALPTNGNLSNGTGDYPLYLSSVAGKTTNFYLTNLTGSNVTIWAKVNNGPINLWVNNTGTGGAATDSISGNIDIVAYKTLDGAGKPVLDKENSPQFHVYYSNQNGSLNITGGGSTQNIYAMFYLYNTTSTGAPFGAFTTGGTVTIKGAIYANTVGDGTGGGNFTVDYPTTVGTGSNNGILFGLTSPWTEYNPARGN